MTFGSPASFKIAATLLVGQDVIIYVTILFMSLQSSSFFFTPIQLKDFGEGRDFGSATRAYQQSLERCQANIDWMNLNAESMEKWLEENMD